MTPVLYAEDSIPSGSLRCETAAADSHDFAAGSRACVRDHGPAIEPVIANDRFQDLMTIIGPSGRDEFLSCLATDLANASGGLDHAARYRDDRAARRWGHALIGLAGTVGATRLHDLARAFNVRLADDPLTDALHLLPEVRAEVDRLIQFFQRATDPETVS